MEIYMGKSVVQKAAAGKIYFYEKRKIAAEKKKIKDARAESVRFEKARLETREEIRKLYEKAQKETEELSEILKVYMLILEDPDYHEAVKKLICSQSVTAEYAVAMTEYRISEMFAQMDDEYMKAREVDIRDISERLLAVLTGCKNTMKELKEPVILAVDDLTPSEMVQMDKSKILAFVTKKGTLHSHTAILSRTRGIPLVIGVDVKKEWDGKPGIVDGYQGCVIINPGEEEIRKIQEKILKEEEKEKSFETLKGMETVTKDGTRIRLCANIGSLSDISLALKNDAEGIGLFRSEFLYLESDDYPSEEEQFLVYKKAAENMGERRVIIRTMDIGADKNIEYFHLKEEENPVLGYRAIRICLTKKEIFKTQLRALLRAGIYGNLAVLFPMIISVEEVRKIKEIMEEVKEELKAEKHLYKEAKIGIMIETPAAVMISEELAKEVDFFSIGTNDLTQYTLAIDRQNPDLEQFYDAHHPAVLKMIQMTIENGHKGGVWVGICGALAEDRDLTEKFLSMGVDELSVPPVSILPLRKKIRETDLRIL